MSGLLILVGLIGLVLALTAVVRGRVDWARTRTRRTAALVGVGSLSLVILGGALAPPTPTATASRASTADASPPSAAASTSAGPPSTDPVAAVPSPVDSPTSTETPPVGLRCSDVGGVFVAHGTDGRGDCMSADPRPSCHVPPEQQDGDYLAELTLTPPFPDGTVDTPSSIDMASNPQCWKQPPS